MSAVSAAHEQIKSCRRQMRGRKEEKQGDEQGRKGGEVKKRSMIEEHEECGRLENSKYERKQVARKACLYLSYVCDLPTSPSLTLSRRCHMFRIKCCCPTLPAHSS